MKPTIIFLNGTSSSGKSSITKALIQQWENPLLNVSVDNLFSIIPKKLCNYDPFIYYGNPPMIEKTTAQLDETFKQLMELFPKYISGYHRSIRAFYEAGNSLVVDHVLQEESWHEECVGLLHNKHAYFIGVDCPLDILIQREKERGDRPIGMAKYQYSKIHGKEIYDLRVDTSKQTATDCARKIIAHINSQPPTAFNTLYLKENGL